MKNLENEKFTMQTMMQHDLRQVNYAVSHSRHSATRSFNPAPNETSSQQRLAARECASYSQTSSIRAVRY